MGHADIVVVGSLNMDMVVSTDRFPQIGETIMGQHLHIIPGGKGANQAVGCAKLGANVAMLGAVGDDHFGPLIINNMKQYGIETSEIATLNTTTGTATIIHTVDDNCIVVVLGANGEYSVERLEASEQFIARATVLLVQLEIDIATVERALQIARANHVRTILNPAPATALSRQLLRLADVLTPNETELKQLCGRDFSSDEELEQILLQWEREYEHKVIVTRGSIGCSYLDHKRLITIPSPAVTVKDTTGAGDAFNAALAFSLYRGDALPDAVHFAVRAASLSVRKFGAQAGMPTLQEVLDFKQAISDLGSPVRPHR